MGMSLPPRRSLGHRAVAVAAAWLMGAAAPLGCAPAAEPSDPDASAPSDGGLFGDTGALPLDTVAPADTTDASATDTKPKDFDGSRNPLPGVLLLGTVLTPSQSYVGQVLIQGDTITCAEPGQGCAAQAQAVKAKTIDTKGILVPGLIDMHNHILFDIFDGDDWLPSKTYLNHTEWPKEVKYGAMLDVKQCLENASQGKPKWCPAPYNSKEGHLKCEMNKWGELKGLVAGTTSIVGLAGASVPCFHSLARSIDTQYNDLEFDKIQTSALFPPSTEAGDGVCKNYAKGDTQAYLIHCGEGVDTLALGEFNTLATLTTEDGCLLSPNTVLTHGTAFGPAEFAKMKENGVKLTWSPASNVALYGTTANIPAAIDAGVLVSLGPDWSMGGSQNLLDELRFADEWDNKHWGNRLSAKDLLTMATFHAAYSLQLQDQIGQIKAGLRADLFVIDGLAPDPYDAVLKATPAEVKLVLVNGVPLYGDVALQELVADNPGCEKAEICGRGKFLCVAENSSAEKLGQTLADIKAALEKGLLAMDAATPADGWNFAPLTPLVRCKKP